MGESNRYPWLAIATVCVKHTLTSARLGRSTGIRQVVIPAPHRLATEEGVGCQSRTIKMTEVSTFSSQFRAWMSDEPYKMVQVGNPSSVYFLLHIWPGTLPFLSALPLSHFCKCKIHVSSSARKFQFEPPLYLSHSDRPLRLSRLYSNHSTEGLKATRCVDNGYSKARY
jgi:hypothetical protein